MSLEKNGIPTTSEMDQMEKDMSYSCLKAMYNGSRTVCDPVEFEFKQKLLLRMIAQYLLQRDRPDDSNVSG